MFKSFRKPAVALAAALAISITASVNTTFAEPNIGSEIVIPDTTTITSILVDPSVALTENIGSIDLGGGSSLDAGEMALVSLAARQIQLAKTPVGAKVVAKELIDSTYKWSAREFSCLVSLWNGESHWNFRAHNHYSGATGIAQALPGNKMDVVATDWQTNPITQIKWGIRYIKIRYGTPCKALAKTHWAGYY